jgi:hypothetical protein
MPGEAFLMLGPAEHGADGRAVARGVAWVPDEGDPALGRLVSCEVELEPFVLHQCRDGRRLVSWRPSGKVVVA